MQMNQSFLKLRPIRDFHPALPRRDQLFNGIAN